MPDDFGFSTNARCPKQIRPDLGASESFAGSSGARRHRARLRLRVQCVEGAGCYCQPPRSKFAKPSIPEQHGGCVDDERFGSGIEWQDSNARSRMNRVLTFAA